MDCEWHSCIKKDLEAVEDAMLSSIASANPELTEMCDYVLKVQGKRIRPAMCILVHRACGGTDIDKAINTGAAIELIHNATLIHDDINDEGELRRGRKALYREYALGKSIVTGDYLYAISLLLICSYGNVVKYILEAAANTGTGEFNQKDFEHRGEVTEEDYMMIINGKTAQIIECAAKCGAYLADADEKSLQDVSAFANKVGMAFQIIDDMLDVYGDEAVTGKPVGSDIFEGKPTLPIIYAMQDPKHGKEIRRVFEKNKPSAEETRNAISLIKKTDTRERCYSVARAVVDEALSKLDCLADSEYKRALIDMAEYIVARDR